MNINEELNRIIFKYEIDRYYPHYRNMYRAEKVLRRIIKELTVNKEKAMFVGDDPKGIEFIKNIVRDYTGICFFQYDGKDTELHSLESVSWDDYPGGIFLISFYGAEYVERWFRLRRISCRWVYSIFEKEGIFLQKEFFAFGKPDGIILVDKDRRAHVRSSYTGTLQCELYVQKSRYGNEKDYEMRHIALEKCLFLALYMKDFTAAKDFASLLFETDRKFEQLWEEVEGLLDKIKRELKKSKQENIVLYWLDAIPYGEEDNMPYLSSMKNKSVVFENAFANIAQTASSLRAVFLGKRDIDDGAYKISAVTEENSPVLQLLRGRNYNIKIISGILNWRFPYSCTSEQFFMDLFEPSSMKLWDMLYHMMSGAGKTFYLVHAMEAHDPFLSSRVDDNNCMDKEEMCRAAQLELDRQLAFYEGFLNGTDFRIYMSDHGKGIYQKFHVLFNIYQEGIHAKRIKGMFSLLRFYKVLEQIVTKGGITEDELTEDYVEIGNLDRYDRNDIGKVLRKIRPLEEMDFACKGIVDKNNIYWHSALGKEEVFSRKEVPSYNSLTFYGRDENETEELLRYRELAGEYPINVREDEKFRYSKYLYRLHDNLKKRNSNMAEYVRMINGMLEPYKERSVAVRMGGYHSERLYFSLSKENRRKIWGFIDNDGGCRCSRFSMPVVSIERFKELSDSGIEVIMLFSHNLLNRLREEAEMWPADIEVLDIYETFAEKGMACDKSFYTVLAEDEDYDVGFPFDEV